MTWETRRDFAPGRLILETLHILLRQVVSVDEGNARSHALLVLDVLAAEKRQQRRFFVVDAMREEIPRCQCIAHLQYMPHPSMCVQ